MVPLKAVLSLYSADSGDSMVFVSTKFHGVRSQPIVQSVENFVIQNAYSFQHPAMEDVILLFCIII